MGHTQENEKQNWYLIKKTPHLCCCWFIYVMESRLSSSLLSCIEKKRKSTSSDKLRFSSAPLLCCGSPSSENTLTQLSLSIDHLPVTDGRKQRQPITWIVTKPKSQPRTVHWLMFGFTFNINNAFQELSSCLSADGGKLLILGLWTFLEYIQHWHVIYVWHLLLLTCFWAFSGNRSDFPRSCFCSTYQTSRPVFIFILWSRSPPLCVFNVCRTESTHTVSHPGLVPAPCDCFFSCLLTFQSDILEKAKTTEAHTAYIANAGINRNVCAVG